MVKSRHFQIVKATQLHFHMYVKQKQSSSILKEVSVLRVFFYPHDLYRKSPKQGQNTVKIKNKDFCLFMLSCQSVLLEEKLSMTQRL